MQSYTCFDECFWTNIIDIILNDLYLEISCGVPPDGTNTIVTSSISLVYQDSYNYTCIDGYETNDDITTECLADGSLSLETPPTCTSKCLVFTSFILQIYQHTF